MTRSAVRSPRPLRRRVDGVLLLDKPPGMSSNAALQRAKRLYAAEKAGHTGTLDPLASGLLPICFGEATKFAQALLDARKEYVATVRFGVATTTGDAEGEIVDERPVAFTLADFEAALPRFVGTTNQVPPRHAALKHHGRKYYEYARAGIEIVRTPRKIEIHAIDVLDWAPPFAVLRVACGKGTYVRVLAEDIAIALGSRAHLAALRRTGSAGFSVTDAVTLEVLEAMPLAARNELLRPVDCLLSKLPRLDLDSAQAAGLRCGRTFVAPPGATERYRAYDEAGVLMGVVRCEEGLLVAERMLRCDDASARDAGPLSQSGRSE